jgi:hypothetical protein
MTGTTRLAPMLITAVLLSACDGAPTASAGGSTSFSNGDRNGVDATQASDRPSASGSGLVVFGPNVQRISFHARQREDGTVTGQAEVHNQTADVRVHLEINCLRVFGNVATISGIVTRTSDPARVREGWEGLFQVQDNGEGANSPPDLMSTVLFHEVGIGPDCSVPSEFDMVPISRGNVQVRP